MTKADERILQRLIQAYKPIGVLESDRRRENCQQAMDCVQVYRGGLEAYAHETAGGCGKDT